MSATWDGQPAADLDAALQAMLAAAWEAGRDAAVAEARRTADDLFESAKTHSRGDLVKKHTATELCMVAYRASQLAPPADLGAAIRARTP